MAKLTYKHSLGAGEVVRKIIQVSLEEVGLKIKNKSLQTYEIWHPALQHQLGAIYFGGDDKKVNEDKVIAYVELRFYKEHLKNLNLLDRLDAIVDFRLDTTNLLRFRFNKLDTAAIEQLCIKVKTTFY